MQRNKIARHSITEELQAWICSHEDDRQQAPGVARRRLGGYCKRNHQNGPRHLLQAHHRPEAPSVRQGHG